MRILGLWHLAHPDAALQGCHSRAHPVTAAPEQETNTPFVKGAAHPAHQTSVLGAVCKALSGALARTGPLSKEDK